MNFCCTLLSGFVLMAACLPLLSPILRLLGATGETLPYARQFLLISILGSPLIIATVALSETIRGEGASTASMTGMLLSVGVNIVFDPLFIFILKLNVMGAALATVIGNGCAVAYFVRYLTTKSKVQSVSLKDCRPDKAILAGIFKVGSSAFFFSSLLFNGYAMGHGIHVVAAFGVANRLVQICEFLGMGLFAGAVPLTALSYAAGYRKRLDDILSTTTLAFLAVTLGVGLILYLFRRRIFGLFSADLRVLEAGFEILNAMMVSALFSGFNGILTDMFQAFGAGIQSNVMAVTRGVALIPTIFFGNRLFGLRGVIWSLPAAEIAACAVGAVLWLVSSGKILSVPIEKRKLLVPGVE